MKKNILVISDDHSSVDFYKSWASKYDFMHCDTIYEGVLIARLLSKSISFIIIDYDSNIMKDISILSTLKKMFPSISFILLSKCESLENNVYQNGGTYFIKKPFDRSSIQLLTYLNSDSFFYSNNLPRNSHKSCFK
jgi:DNA-binding NtrC family response regulator